MIARVFWISVVAVLSVVAFYLSRFWIFPWWGREGLWGLEWARPQGGLVSVWLRGSEFTQFELLFWVIGVFAVLSLLQSGVNRYFK